MLFRSVFAYLKLVKNKPKTKGNDSLDDYDYGEEDSEEWETEDEEVLEDGFEGSDPVSYTHLAVFHMDEQLPFQFEWDWLAPSGLSTKDFIAPSSFEFRTGKQFRIDVYKRQG